MRLLSRLAIVAAVGCLAFTGTANAGYVYLRSTVGAPWGFSDPTDAMDAVFGAGNWSDLRYETATAATVFSAANSFVYMDGSDDNAIEMAAFLAANGGLIESWVAAGGRLFLNAAPNEGGDIDLGFGYLLCFGGNAADLCGIGTTNFSATADADDPAHPIFQGPATPVGTSFTGGQFSHGILLGGFGEGILTSAAFNSILRERDFGAGHVVVGTMTLPTFQDPDPNAANLWRNTIAYAAVHGGLVLTNEGESSDNIARAAALLRQTARADLLTLANTPPETLAGYQSIWVNPRLGVAYATLRTAVAPAGSLEQYVSNGGTLVLNVAGNSGSQNDIAPGGVDYDRTFTHNAESFSLPAHPYLTGTSHNGVPLAPSDFNSWGATDHGFLTNLLPGDTVLSNDDGPSFVQYGYGAGQVILTTLTYGWGGAGARGDPRDNLLFYAAGPRIGSGVPNIGRFALDLFTLRVPGVPGDTLPVGPSIFYWAGVFDTGSTRVTLEDTAATSLDFFNPAVPPFLDVRQWGLGAMNKLSLGAPLDFPQTETPLIDVLVTPGLPSLIGGPVTNEVLADIDYGRIVERDFLSGVIKSAADTFYEPGDPAIPTPLFWVDLLPIGVVNPGVTGQRYLFVNTRFIKGGSTQTSAAWDFLYDTGNTTTQVTTTLATALGINLAAPPDDVVCLGASLPTCSGGTLLDGYLIDRVEIDELGAGTRQYAIDQPIVFVQPAGLGGADANVGSNFFVGNRVLFDGPGSRLGLDAVGPVIGLPEPGGIASLIAGLALLVAVGRRRMRSSLD